MSHWAYEGVKTVRALGLLDGGYSNDYGLDNELSKWKFQNLYNKLLDKLQVEHPYYEVSDEPTCAEIVKAVAAQLGCEDKDYNAQVVYLQDLGVIDQELAEYFTDGTKRPLVAETVMLAAEVYNYLALDK